MSDVLGPSVDVASGGQDTHYVPGHPQYDAVRLNVDGSNSTADSVDITFRTYESDDVRSAQSNGDYSSMDTVHSDTGVDVSSGGNWGTSSLSRVVAVRVNDDSGVGSDGVSGTIEFHEAGDPDQNADAFLNR